MRRRSGVIGKLLCEMGLCRRQHFPPLRNDAHVATDSGSIEIPAALESAIRCIPRSGLVQRALCRIPFYTAWSMKLPRARRSSMRHKKDLLAAALTYDRDRVRASIGLRRQSRRLSKVVTRRKAGFDHHQIRSHRPNGLGYSHASPLMLMGRSVRASPSCPVSRRLS